MATLKLHEMLGLKPEEAIAYLESKLPQTTWDKHELSALAHQTTFTVAKLTNAAMLQDVQDALVQALEEGLTMSQFRERLTDKLVAGGWRARNTSAGGQLKITETASGFMGRVNEDGEIGSRFDTPTRLETIFRTNMQSAYMAGRYEQYKEGAEDRPYWQYIAVMDASTRPDHAALDGLVFRHDDPFWQSHTPPNGYNCRCRFAALAEDDMQAQGLKVTSSAGRMRADEVEYQDGRTMPRSGFDTGNGVVWTDPGFNTRPGATGTQGEADLASMAANSIKKLDPALADETVGLIGASRALGRMVGMLKKKLGG
jgi:SPP1 gp7 family putative phage head morphogenesis protein